MTLISTKGGDTTGNQVEHPHPRVSKTKKGELSQGNHSGFFEILVFNWTNISINRSYFCEKAYPGGRKFVSSLMF